MGTERAANIIAASLTSEEVALLLDFCQKPEELTVVFRSLLGLRLIEGEFGSSKLVITQLGLVVISRLISSHRVRSEGEHLCRSSNFH